MIRGRTTCIPGNTFSLSSLRRFSTVWFAAWASERARGFVQSAGPPRSEPKRAEADDEPARPLPRTDAASGSFSPRVGGGLRWSRCGLRRGQLAIQGRHGTDSSVRETSSLRVIGQERPEGAAETKAVVLSFDCFRDNAISTIMTDQALRQGTAEARLTLDAGKPRRIPGFAGTTPSGGQLVLTIPQDSMLALLSRHQHASIEYVDGAGSSKTVAEFPLAGLEKYRAPFRAACGKAGAR